MEKKPDWFTKKFPEGSTPAILYNGTFLDGTQKIIDWILASSFPGSKGLCTTTKLPPALTDSTQMKETGFAYLGAAGDGNACTAEREAFEKTLQPIEQALREVRSRNPKGPVYLTGTTVCRYDIQMTPMLDFYEGSLPFWRSEFDLGNRFPEISAYLRLMRPYVREAYAPTEELRKLHLGSMLKTMMAHRDARFSWFEEAVNIELAKYREVAFQALIAVDPAFEETIGEQKGHTEKEIVRKQPRARGLRRRHSKSGKSGMVKHELNRYCG